MLIQKCTYTTAYVIYTSNSRVLMKVHNYACMTLYIPLQPFAIMPARHLHACNRSYIGLMDQKVHVYTLALHAFMFISRRGYILAASYCGDSIRSAIIHVATITNPT